MRCLYCDAPLEVSEPWPLTEKLVYHRPEEWENGFNAIFRPLRDHSSKKNSVISCFLGIELPENITDSESPFPIARLKSGTDAEALAMRLGKSGLNVQIIEDDVLNAAEAPIRLRKIDFGGGAARFISFGGDAFYEVPAAEISVIVAGSVFKNVVESAANKRKEGRAAYSESETFADEKLIDIYLRGEHKGFRVTMRGFDFSCLGQAKAITATENISALGRRLKDFAPDAAYIDDYDRRRIILDAVWGLEERRESRGLRRARFGRFEFVSSESSTNLAQFTKYSRLQAIFQ